MQRIPPFFFTALTFSLLQGKTTPLPDTAYVAQPHLVYKVGTRLLPSGVEKIGSFQKGDTLFVWIRFWEAAPQGMSWSWAGETLSTIVKIPPPPPDSLMPQADFSIPPEAGEKDSEPAEFPWAVFLSLATLLLASLSLYSLYKAAVWRLFQQVYLYLRWKRWLFQWRRPDPARFPEFIQAVKALLTPHVPFHPGSLSRSEVLRLEGKPSLQQALLHLWEAEYQISFEQKELSTDKKTKIWRETWKALSSIRPSPAPLFRLPGHRMPSEYKEAGGAPPLHVSP
ncbi:MAG: hypothetical protein N2253_07200 [Bacteroidia bacterium]|nr:hypothetical protein [Bacteroidia bacterium]MDW8056776.1 hypothetical protein [Bacteroidia bacterium]